jgi:hypothetical protein
MERPRLVPDQPLATELEVEAREVSEGNLCIILICSRSRRTHTAITSSPPSS